jgi:hypothetical protein
MARKGAAIYLNFFDRAARVSIPMEYPTCSCGHRRDHQMVSPEPQYGVLGYVRLMIGGTPTPTRIRYRCRVCNQVFDQTDDPAERQRHL